jgi:hypothetical protein
MNNIFKYLQTNDDSNESDNDNINENNNDNNDNDNDNNDNDNDNDNNDNNDNVNINVNAHQSNNREELCDSDDSDNILLKNFKTNNKRKQFKTNPYDNKHNHKKIMCQNFIDTNSCTYKDKCLYAHNREEQKIDIKRKKIFDILDSKTDLSSLEYYKNKDIYKELQLFTKLCNECVKNKCTGGNNCKFGAPYEKYLICYDDLNYGSCKDDKYCNKIHLTKRNLKPQYSNIYSNITKPPINNIKMLSSFMNNMNNINQNILNYTTSTTTGTTTNDNNNDNNLDNNNLDNNLDNNNLDNNLDNDSVDTDINIENIYDNSDDSECEKSIFIDNFNMLLDDD